MRKFLFLPILLLFITVHGQQNFVVKGQVIDTAGQPLSGVTLKLQTISDSAFATSDRLGSFSFSNSISGQFTILATSIGLQTFFSSYPASSQPVYTVATIIMEPSSGQLDSVLITSVRPVLVKEDTVQFDPRAYKVREGAPVEDVIKKLPGVTVDKDGNIETQGKKITRVRVNGKDFFGGDLQTATQNLPADIIENIQIIDDYGDQANLTGVKNGEPEKIININTQRNRNKGNFGNATAAVGNEKRYAGNLFINNFNNDRQMSVLGAVNNTNANLFNFNGGGRGGGARGANLGSDNRGGGGGGAGITLSKSIGANYRDKWGKKISVYGSYSLSARNTEISSSTFSQDINPQNIRNTQRESRSLNNSINHRLTWNMEYTIDSFNFIKFSPYLSHSSGENESRSSSEIVRGKYVTLNNSFNTNKSSSPNGGGNVLFNHKFRKPGRNFSSNFSVDFSTNQADRFSNNAYRNTDSLQNTTDTTQIQSIYTNSKNARTNLRVSYSEPLNTSGSTAVELSYDLNRSLTESIREVTDLQDSTGKNGSFNQNQSNHFNYTFTTNRASLLLRGRQAKYNYSVGIQAQPSALSGRSLGKGFTTSYTNVNWIPTGRFVYNFARSNSLTLTVDGSAREPSFFQLQPIADSSNLNNILIGNPNLRNEFTNTVALRYNKFDNKAGTSLFVNLSYHRTNDKIVSNRINNVTGTGRSTSYLNTDGFEGYNGNASYTRPFSNRKYTASISMNASYDNNISFTDNQKNRGSNWNLRPGASFRLDLDDVVDLTLRGNYTLYQTTTRYTDRTFSTKAQSLNIGLDGKNYFGNFTIGYDFSKLVNYNFSSQVNSNPAILNMFAEYRMLKGKMMTLRLQGFDLLNNNTGITRTVNETTITDSRTVRLARYFLLSANLRLAKFRGAR